ncbi:MAG TPA: hypothetical protein VHA33_07355 [Candidatus Angelobacter sp.]|jgi:hypothetical protein|nr:hypothetical protein [Candidatus Angelobacter sp.]
MRKLVAICVLLVGALAAGAAQKNIDQMKAEADKAEGGHQAKLCADLAQLLVPIADQQFTEGNVVEAQKTVQEILNYATKARDASIKSRSKMKETEITLRTTQRKLEALKRTLAADDRPPLDAIEKKLEQLRQDLLNEMFAPPKKKGS